ncbi:amino acid permease [Haladaptatus sp. NG-WS-4]
MPGTIVGIGAWFTLVFKSAFAVVGLGAYLLLVVSVPAEAVTVVGLVLALGLFLVNVVGVKQSGRLQAAIVSVVLLSLVVFIGDGLTYVDQPNYHPFLAHGGDGLLAATGFVFVSYAGVTKIASVAEEVEDPGRNIPAGIISSVVLMMFVYTFVVFVIVGVAPAAELSDSLTPMALATNEILGSAGQLGISVVAVLALTSMANAGILSSSRYPLAMSRDSLAPPILARINDRFRTPVFSIGFTGLILVILVLFVPVVSLAKLASAFQILVFVFVNAALVAFRESELSWYEPEFVAPAYPWVQLFGMLGGLVLLTQMGPIPIAGAVGIVTGGLLWYRLYGRERTEREGAALDAIRRSSVERALERTREVRSAQRPMRLLVPVGREPTPERRRELVELIRLGSDVVRPTDGRVQVVHFEEIPEQLGLSAAVDQSTVNVELESDTGELLEATDVPVEFGEIVTHDTKRAVANFADHYDVDIVLGEWHPSRWHAELLGADVDWYMRNTAADLVFVRNRGYDSVDEITVIADQGPFDPLEIVVADGIATASDATIRFVATVEESASDKQLETAVQYLDALGEFCRRRCETTVVTSDDSVEGMVDAARSSDVVVIGTSAHHLVYDVLFGAVPDELVERLECTVLLTHSRKSRRHTFLRALIDRLVY